VGAVAELSRSSRVATRPFCSGRVFQTLDGTTRIYAMPFSPPDRSPDAAAPLGVTMWQLSFPIEVEAARALGSAGGEALLAEALDRWASQRHWLC